MTGLNIHQIASIFTEESSPLRWVWCAFLGFFMNRYVRHRSASWIGTIGIVYMTVVVVWDFTATGHSEFVRSLPGGFWRDEFDQLFTSKCSASECLGQLFATMPSLALISYSIGA